MTPQQKKLILQFMRMVLADMHPNFDEYPIATMNWVIDEELAVDGTGFEKSEFRWADELIQAYWMNRIIKDLEQA